MSVLRWAREAVRRSGLGTADGVVVDSSEVAVVDSSEEAVVETSEVAVVETSVAVVVTAAATTTASGGGSGVTRETFGEEQDSDLEV